jgi:hypothetical protein
MLRRNCGKLDRTVRLVLGTILLPIGLLPLGGLRGDLLGQVAVAVSLLWLATGASGFCVLYVPFGISTVERKKATPLT